LDGKIYKMAKKAEFPIKRFSMELQRILMAASNALRLWILCGPLYGEDIDPLLANEIMDSFTIETWNGLSEIEVAISLMQQYRDMFQLLPNGNEPKYVEWINSKQWKNLREHIFRKQKNKCALCDNTCERLGHEHTGDLVGLCAKCHAKFHDKEVRRGKKGK